MSQNKPVFKENAQAYWDKGFSAIPIDPKTKRGGIGWNEFNKRIPNLDEQQKMLSSKPTYGLGIVCGPQNIVAIDFDYENDDWEEIEAVVKNIIPPSPVGKKGSKGWTYFYRFEGKLSTKAINRKCEVVNEKTGEVKIKNFRVIDILDNRITVMPPTIHPKTGMSYEWLTEKTLLDISIEDLPIYTEEMSRDIKKLVTNPDELGLAPKTTKPKEEYGRHDILYAFFRSNVEKAYDFNDLKKMVANHDIKIHSSNPKGPMFLDHNMYKDKGSAEAFLDYEISRWFKDFEKKFYLKNRKAFSFRGNFTKTADSVEAELASKYPSYHDGFHFISEKGLVPSYYELANYIHEKYELYYTDAAGYVWNGKHYEAIKDLNIKNKILVACKNNLDPKNLDLAFKIVKTLNPRTMNEATPGLINLGNGVLNIFTREIMPHSKDLCFTYVNNLEYDPDAKCTRWFEFLNEVLSEDQELIAVCQEMFGYTLMGGYPFLHKAFVLQGGGRNGKSTFLDVLKAMLGDTNYTSVPLQKLEKDFSAVLLNNKLANILGELTTGVINNEYFKTVVGGEPIIMSNKGKDQFVKEVYARFIFATNGIPSFGDTSAGLYERLCFIPFEKFIEQDKRDTMLVSKLLKELPGILNWAIEGARRVWINKRLTVSTKSNLMLETWREDADSVMRFVKDEISISGKEHHILSTNLLYDLYIDSCKNDGCRAFAKSRFVTKVITILKKVYPGFEFNAGKSRNNFVRGVHLKGKDAPQILCSQCNKIIIEADVGNENKSQLAEHTH